MIRAVLPLMLFPLGAGRLQLDFKIHESDGRFARDEYGRTCNLSEGKLVPFVRDGETFWRLRGAVKGAPNCQDEMIFKLDTKRRRFLVHDHGFEDIFKTYARRACRVMDDQDGRPLSEAESQKMADCFLKPNEWGLYLTWLRHRLDLPEHRSEPRREVCTTHLLAREKLVVSCRRGFKKMAEDSVFRDVVVIKSGTQKIEGTGAAASRYVLHPDFNETVDLKGHGHVYHLARHNCRAKDVFQGCVSVED